MSKASHNIASSSFGWQRIKVSHNEFYLIKKIIVGVQQKRKYDSIICKWQIYFQTSEYKKRNFLNLNDDNNQPIYPTYFKNSA